MTYSRSDGDTTSGGSHLAHEGRLLRLGYHGWWWWSLGWYSGRSWCWCRYTSDPETRSVLRGFAQISGKKTTFKILRRRRGDLSQTAQTPKGRLLDLKTSLGGLCCINCDCDVTASANDDLVTTKLSSPLESRLITYVLGGGAAARPRRGIFSRFFLFVTKTRGKLGETCSVTDWPLDHDVLKYGRRCAICRDSRVELCNRRRRAPREPFLEISSMTERVTRDFLSKNIYGAINKSIHGTSWNFHERARWDSRGYA